MAKRDIFLVIVGVTHDGVVDIDFSGSYDHTYDPETEQDDVYDDNSPGAEILDGILGVETGTVAPPSYVQLRRLADYLEKQETA